MIAVGGEKMLDEARLARARFTGHGRDTALAGCGVAKESVQLRQKRFALEKVHVAESLSTLACGQPNMTKACSLSSLWQTLPCRPSSEVRQ
jgi:hypothetical protein